MNKRIGTRRVGTWVEYECQSCRDVLQAKPTAPEDELCEACRGLTAAQHEIRSLRRKVSSLENEVERLARENTGLCDTVADREEKIRELQDTLFRLHGATAPTEPPPSRAA